jgi:hypothetical protein
MYPGLGYVAGTATAIAALAAVLMFVAAVMFLGCALRVLPWI